MKLIQIPFSHNCVKVRLGLNAKGLGYEVENIVPFNRFSVIKRSGQMYVPVLVDGDRTIAGSTAILQHLDAIQPDPPLLPSDPVERKECLRLSNWADANFMAASRRIAYSQITQHPDAMAAMFAPNASGAVKKAFGYAAVAAIRARFGITARRVAQDIRNARLASESAITRLGGERYLFGDTLTIADLSLAAMSRPLAAGPPQLTSDPAVAALLSWGDPIIGDEYPVPVPRPASANVPAAAG